MKRIASYLLIGLSIVVVNLPGFCFGLTLKVTAIDGGGAHTIALREDGTVWAYGENGSGQLGDGTDVDKNNPTRLSALSGVVSVVAGTNHTLAVKADGTAWAWGANGYNQLGDGTTTNRLSPVQVKDPSDPSGFLTGVVRVAAGERYSMALKSNGTVWSWGYNYTGQLGDGTYVGKTAPVQVKDPSDPSGFLKGVSAISAGGAHSVALKTNGTVWTWRTHDTR
jgi:alpha-tubulin suppressor-like RCC1 family protein